MAKAFSAFLVMDLIFCVLLGIFIPYTWLIVIGWEGILLGLKLMSLIHRSDLGAPARARLCVFGITTLFNLIFLTGLGGVFCYASFRPVHTAADSRTWVLISLFFSAMMTYACWALASLHVSRSGISQILGLVGRPRGTSLPRSIR